MLILQLHKGTGLFSRVIRWFSRSDYSHVSLWFWDARDAHGGLVFEAIEGHGVRVLPADHYRQARTAGRIVCYTLREPMDVTETMAAWHAANAEVGAHYDWLGVFRFVTRRRKNGHPDKWFCSELAAYALERAGRPLFNDKASWQVMPGDIPHSLAVVRTDNPEFYP